jgi:hypothetical protein
VGDELFRVDGWTDTTMLIVTFCNFVNAPKKRSRGLLVIFCSYSVGDMLICYLEDRKFCLRIVDRNTRFLPSNTTRHVTFLHRSLRCFSSSYLPHLHLVLHQNVWHTHSTLTNVFSQYSAPICLRCRSYFLSVHSLPTVLM